MVASCCIEGYGEEELVAERERKGPVTVAFDHSPGDQVETATGDVGIVEACTFERGGNYYTVLVTGGVRAWVHQDDVTPWNEIDPA
jgi:hypothetical protein